MQLHNEDQAYKDRVNHLMLVRLRIASVLCLTLHPLAGVLDIIQYPYLARFFIEIRFWNCFIVAAILMFSFFPSFKKVIAWMSDALMLDVALGIIFMIYLGDGAKSNYYQGVTLCILGLLIINGFYFWHNVGTCLMIMLAYTVATFANPENWTWGGYFFGIFFIASNSILVAVITRLYSAQHFEAFISNAKLKDLYKEADHRARIDELTQVHNRRALMEYLGLRWEGMEKTGKEFYVVIFDVDHFKQINDNYGHSFGDQVISEMAAAVKKQLRSDSFFARYGGDEFIFILDAMSREQFFARVEQIREAVKRLRLFFREQPVPISISFGAVRVTRGKYEKVEELIEEADHALLSVKRQKRGEIHLVEK